MATVHPPKVVTGELIASAWGNQVVDGVVHIFDSVAERDTAWTSPPNGAVCQAPAGVWWNRVGGVWRQFFPLPGFTETGTVGAPAGSAQALGVSNSVTATYRYRISMTGLVGAGNQAAGTAATDMIRGTDGSSQNSSTVVIPAAPSVAIVTFIAVWDVQVGQSGQFYFRITPTTNVWAYARASWTITPY